MIQAFTSGLLIGVRQWKLTFIVYLLQLLLAMTIGMQAFQVFDASIGNSLEITKLIESSDNTVITDFLNVHGASLSPLIGQLRWVLLLYGLFSIFINAGLIYGVIKGENRWKSFWMGASTYFFPFLLVALFYVTILVLWTAVLILPFLGSFPNALEALSSEAPLLWIMGLILFVYAIGLMFLFNCSVGTRTALIQKRIGVWMAIRKGISWGVRKFFSASALHLLFQIGFIAFASVYLWMESSTGMTTPFLICLFMIVQQILLLLRICWKIMLYGGTSKLFIQSSRA